MLLSGPLILIQGKGEVGRNFRRHLFSGEAGSYIISAWKGLRMENE